MRKKGQSKPGAIGGKKRKRRTPSKPIVDSIEGQSAADKRSKQMSQAQAGNQLGQVQGSAVFQAQGQGPVLMAQEQGLDSMTGQSLNQLEPDRLTTGAALNPAVGNSSNLLSTVVSSANSINNGSQNSSRNVFDLTRTDPSQSLVGKTINVENSIVLPTQVPLISRSASIDASASNEIDGERSGGEQLSNQIGEDLAAAPSVPFTTSSAPGPNFSVPATISPTTPFTTSSVPGISSGDVNALTPFPLSDPGRVEEHPQSSLQLSQQLQALSSLMRDGFKVMQDEISGVKNQLANLTGTVVQGRTTEAKAAKSRRTVEATKQIESFDLLFDKFVAQLVFETCVMVISMKIVMNQSSDEDFLSRVALSVQALMFSLLPGDCKVSLQSKIGTHYCTLRRAMVRTALGTVQQDVFCRFEAEDKQDRTDSSRRNCTWKGIKLHKYGPKVRRPQWSFPQFITLEHVNEVQTRLENIQGDGKSRVKEENVEIDRELALNVCGCLFTKMTNLMTKARDRCKRTLFEDIGFLFCNWAKCGVTVDQFQTEFVWNVEHDATRSLDSISDATLMIIGRSNEDDVRRSNMNMWMNMITQNRSFTLLVAYQVSVHKTGVKKGAKRSAQITVGQSADGKQGADGKEGSVTNKQMYRAFNLFDIALNFYCSYCGCKMNDTRYDILSSSTQSFRTIYSMASLLRKWIEELVSEYRKVGPSAFIHQPDTNRNKENKDLCIYDFFPSYTRMQSTLSTSSL